MSRSIVNVGECGFWLTDSLLELWLRLASLHIEDPVESATLATKIRDQWLIASRGYFSGCVPFSLDEDIATAEGKQLVIEAILSLQKSLKRAPAKIDGNTLNLLGIEGRFGGEIETWRLIEVGQAILDLVLGKITTTPSDSPMPGCR
jgi:hypothetical protein